MQDPSELRQLEIEKLELEHRMRMDELRYRSVTQSRMLLMVGTVLVSLLIIGGYFLITNRGSDGSAIKRVEYRMESISEDVDRLKEVISKLDVYQGRSDAEIDYLKAKLSALEAKLSALEAKLPGAPE